MKKLSAIISLLLVSMCFIGQVERFDNLNRQGIRMLDLKSSKIKSEIVQSKVFICNPKEECPNEKPYYTFEFDNKGNKIKTTFSEESHYLTENWTFQDEYSFSKELIYKEGVDSTSSSKYLYFHNESNLCVKFIAVYNSGPYIWEPTYNNNGHITSYTSTSIWDNDTIVDTSILELKYDKLLRLIESKEYYSTDLEKEYCYSHKSYQYKGDSVIILKHVGKDLKISQQEIIRKDNNGHLLMYEKTEYKKYYPLNSRRKKISRIEKNVYDQFGNNIEWQWFNAYHKKENVHKFYSHTLDSNGNKLRTETKNKKGRITEIIVIEYEYKKN
jgi:hypothetical protein